MNGLTEAETSCVEEFFRSNYARECIEARNIYAYLSTVPEV